MSHLVIEADDRVDQDHEVGPEANLPFVVNELGIVVHPGGSGQVSPGREAHDANLARVDTPVARVFTDKLDGALGVFKRCVCLILNDLFIGQPVLEDKRGYSLLGESLSHFEPFPLNVQVGVPATGADDHGRLVRVVALGDERGERGIGHLGDNEVPGPVPDMFFRDGFRFFGVKEKLLGGHLLRWQGY